MKMVLLFNADLRSWSRKPKLKEKVYNYSRDTLGFVEEVKTKKQCLY